MSKFNAEVIHLPVIERKPCHRSFTLEMFYGSEYTKKFILDIITKYIDNQVDFLQDYKSKLQELMQSEQRDAVTYVTIDEKGPAHDKTFVVNVLYNGIVLGTGSGKSKKEAEEKAAKSALEKGII